MGLRSKWTSRVANGLVWHVFSGAAASSTAIFVTRVTIVLIVIVVTAAIAAIAGSVCRWLPKIIAAFGVARSEVISAKGDARIEITSAKTREALFAAAAKHPEHVEAFKELIRLQPADANLRKERRMTDEYLHKSLASPRIRNKLQSPLEPGGDPPGRNSSNANVRYLQPPAELIARPFWRAIEISRICS
jgi:hypothetical protein